MSNIRELREELIRLQKYQERLIDMHNSGMTGFEPSITECGIDIAKLKERCKQLLPQD